MQLKINKGDKISVKIGKRFKKHEVISYDPSEGWDDLHLEDMIDYFEETEEYEKCAELKKILDNYV